MNTPLHVPLPEPGPSQKRSCAATGHHGVGPTTSGAAGSFKPVGRFNQDCATNDDSYALDRDFQISKEPGVDHATSAKP